MADPAPKRTVLLVADDDGLLDERLGFPQDFDVRTATDAREAWELMRTMSPVAAVMDLRTGSAGGYSLARDMAADARLARIPIVMVLERTQDEWLAKQAGANAVLTRPLPPGILVTTTLSLL